MKHIGLRGLLALLSLTAIAASCTALPRAVETEADFTGRITQLEYVGTEGRVGLVLVEAKVVREGTEYLDKYMVTVKDDTLILEQVGQDRRPATFEALAVGQQVQVWFSGPVAESYPAQVAARQLLILDFLQT